MGNVQSEVSDAVKKQADVDISKTKIYGLIGLSKGGDLIDLLRNAMRTKDYEGVSESSCASQP